MLSPFSGALSVQTRLACIFLFLLLLAFHFGDSLLVFSFFSFIPLMANVSVTSVPSRSVGVCYAPFTLDVYLHEYEGFLYAERLDAMPFNGDAETMYDACNGSDCDTAFGGWSQRCAHWGRQDTVLRSDDIRYVDISFLLCEE